MTNTKILFASAIIIIATAPLAANADYGVNIDTFAFNGDYCDTNTSYNGKEIYELDGGGNFLYYNSPTESLDPGNNYWQFMTTNPPGVYPTDWTGYTTTPNQPDPTLLTAFALLGTGGSGSHSGTISNVTCGGGGGASSTPDSATSTPDQAQTNLFYGIVIMFLTFFMLNQFTKK